ncbi:MAG TPA: tetratricopeptide repeat protein [Streptosporangiaceae bacterium]|nr:tetratricopeptide repeat protein [Streptosporangiaceae bacterium]
MTYGVAAFGIRLRDSRESAGLSQRELATRSGLSVRAIGNLERGATTRPHPDSVHRLADALGLRGEARQDFIATARPRSPGDGEAWEAAPPKRPVPAGGARIMPRQLPAPVRQFTGRHDELAALTRLLDQAGEPGGMLVTVLAGTAGVGKTSLAVHWAHRVAGRFPDGQLYLNLRGFDPSGGPMPVAEAIRGLLDSLAVPAAQIPASVDAQVGLYRSLLSGQRMLVLLDNAADAAQVRPLLPGSPGHLVVVTSRSHLGGLIAVEGACPLTLEVLDDAEARDLLAQRLGPARLAAEPDAVTELIALCAGLPLALAIAAARVSARPRLPLGEFTQELAGARRRLDALDAGDAPASARAVFARSLTMLSPAAVRLFALLGLHPGPDIGAHAAASLAGLPPPLARRVLAELADAHLITEQVQGRFGLHDLLRAYAVEQAAAVEADDRQAALGRVFDHYVHTASAASLLLNPARVLFPLSRPHPGVTPEPLTGHEQAMAWFEAESQVLTASVALAARTGLCTYVWQLPWALADFLLRRGQWHESIALHRTALAAATRVGDLAARAAAHRHIAWSCTRLTDYAEATAQLAASLELHQQLGDKAGQARVQQALGAVADSQGRDAEALDRAEQALALYAELGDLAGQAGALNDIGWSHAQLGDFRRARTCCQDALALHRKLGNRPGEAVGLDSLGYIEHHLGHLPEAATCFQSAIALFRELGARVFEAEGLTRLGDTWLAAGEPGQAADAWRQAVAVYEDLEHAGAGAVRTKLAELGQPPG